MSERGWGKDPIPEGKCGFCAGTDGEHVFPCLIQVLEWEAEEARKPRERRWFEK